MVAPAGAVALPGAALALWLQMAMLVQLQLWQRIRRTLVVTNVAEHPCAVWRGSWQLFGQRMEARDCHDTDIAPALNLYCCTDVLSCNRCMSAIG